MTKLDPDNHVDYAAEFRQPFGESVKCWNVCIQDLGIFAILSKSSVGFRRVESDAAFFPSGSTVSFNMDDV